MKAATTHRDLLAWQEAMTLVELVYRHTAGFPKHETFGLTTQLRRAAVSIASNIAEGAARNSSREFAHFLGITCGSLAEVETQLELCARLGFVESDSDVWNQMNRVGKLVRLLRQSVRAAIA